MVFTFANAPYFYASNPSIMRPQKFSKESPPRRPDRRVKVSPHKRVGSQIYSMEKMQWRELTIKPSGLVNSTSPMKEDPWEE